MMTTQAELFTRCGHFLCGDGPKWKEQLADLLKLRSNSVDNMSKAQSRIPMGVWRDLLALVEARGNELWPLKMDLLSVTGAEQPFRDVRVSPAIVGTSLGQRTIDELNRRLSALPQGHEFQRVTAYPVGNGAAIFSVPADMPDNTIEGLKKWVTHQVEELGSELNPHMQTNARGTFGG